jgi:hypothetical protein
MHKTITENERGKDEMYGIYDLIAQMCGHVEVKSNPSLS